MKRECLVMCPHVLPTCGLGRIATRLAAVGVLALAAVATPASAQPLFIGPSFDVPGIVNGNAIVLPSTPTGGANAIACNGFCFYVNGVACSGSGTFTFNNVPGAPFTVKNVHVGPSSSCAGGTPVTPPAFVGVNQAIYFDVDFAPTAPGRYVDAIVLNENPTDIFGTATSIYPCNPDAHTACLANGRFMLTATFKNSQSSGTANVVTLTPDTAYLWFTQSSNVEATVKVLNGCPINNRWWVFAGGLTNQRVVLTVTDTVKHKTVTYTNFLNTPFQPIQDTNALDSCP